MDDSRDVLPDDVKPIHYTLKLQDLCIEAPWTYQGQVEIVLQVQRKTRVVVLNTHELKIHRAQAGVQNEANSDALACDSTKILHDASLQRCFVHFDVDLEPAAHQVVLTLWFEGCMNEYMACFYRSQYTVPDSKPMYMFSTQFEPSEARRAFPCFDEPAAKATFDLQVEVPAGMTVLSNMPVKASIPSASTERSVISFERTPRMSTYLLAWAIGRLEFIEQTLVRKSGQPLPIRVYATQGLCQLGTRGLQVACDVIDYFSEMFDIEYPLPKLDLLAVHEMSDDAMENWGLVTFRPTALLYHETASDPSYLGHMTYIIAHELAHQWFGNLTTMEWWDELWLNEGFATWAGWSACEHLHPEWDVWATFAAEDMRTAFGLDGLRSSHPIQVPIPDGREVDSIFDSISYLKSATVIRMLATFLGLKTFLKGVSQYLKASAYGNATVVALWEALEKASGQDVVSIMRAWVQDVGFPVVTVTELPNDQIHLRQDRFLLSGDSLPDESCTTWWIPLRMPTYEGAQRIDMTTRECTIPQVDMNDFCRLNAGQMGFYLTKPPPAMLERLCDKIQQASPEDKIGLLSDVATLAVSGRGSNTAAVLSVISRLGTTKPTYAVFSLMLYCIERIRSIFSNDQDVSCALEKFTETVVSKAATELGWSVHPDDTHLTIKSRALILSAAGLAGHVSTVEQALQYWDSFKHSRDASAIHPSLRCSVFSIAMRHSGLEVFDTLREEYAHNQTPGTREIIVEAMSHAPTASLAHKCLTFALQGGMTSTDTSNLMMSLAKNNAARDTVWTFMQENWSLIIERLGGSSAIMEPLIRHTLQVYATEERRVEIEAFFRGKDTTGYTRGLTIALECVGINAAYRERDGEVVRGWLVENGYI